MLLEYRVGVGNHEGAIGAAALHAAEGDGYTTDVSICMKDHLVRQNLGV